jgi:hypothetical protein
MRATSRRFVVPLAIHLAALLVSPSVLADAHEIDETQRWVPSFGVVWGLFGQKADASIDSSPLAGVTPPEPLRPPTASDQALLNPFAGGTIELMTPRALDDFGRPRAFVHLDLSAALGFSYDVAKEGDPGKLRAPEIPVPEGEISGQGSVVEAEIDPLVLTSGLGVAFAVDVGEWHFRIKPSLEYMRQEVEVRGRLRRAVRLTPPPPAATLDYRFIELGGGKSHTLHGLGPGLEFEVDAARVESFVISVFIGGQAYRMLGDRDVRITDSQTSMAGTESAVWRFEMEEWLYRGAMGVRFRWLPEGDL